MRQIEFTDQVNFKLKGTSVSKLPGRDLVFEDYECVHLYEYLENCKEIMAWVYLNIF